MKALVGIPRKKQFSKRSGPFCEELLVFKARDSILSDSGQRGSCLEDPTFPKESRLFCPFFLRDTLSPFCASFFLLFSPSPPSPSFLNPPPSSDLKTPPFPRGNTIFRGWGAARVLEGVTPQKKEGISLKNGAQKLVSTSIWGP